MKMTIHLNVDDAIYILAEKKMIGMNYIKKC